MTSPSKTLTERVYAGVRAALLNGTYAPGAPLRLVALGKQYDVSTAVVREALIRLAERHLLVQAPNQGFRVMDISKQDLQDLTEMRALLEGLALRRSIERADMDWEARVVSTHHVLARTPFVLEDMVPTDEWVIAHNAFHQALVSGCDNDRLVALIQVLRDSSELYRQLSVRAKAESGGVRDVAEEHRVLMELAIARDPDEAVAELGSHFQRTADVLVGGVLAD